MPLGVGQPAGGFIPPGVAVDLQQSCGKKGYLKEMVAAYTQKQSGGIERMWYGTFR